MRRPFAQTLLNTLRLEAFSDGVFAIAITLLVLEIKVPELHGLSLRHGVSSLNGALLSLWPSYFGYIFSFVMIGIYWANHHYFFHLFKYSDHFFALLNIFFLMCISFLPFPTAVLAAYITDAHHRQNAITFYAFGLFLPAVAWCAVWLYARWHRRLIDPRLDPGFVAFLTRQYLLSVSLYLAAILLSLWNGYAGLAVCIGISFFYMIPPKQPVYQEGGREHQ